MQVCLQKKTQGTFKYGIILYTIFLIVNKWRENTKTNKVLVCFLCAF